MFVHANADKDWFRGLDKPDTTLKRGVKYFVCGVPNAGKSSLVMNLIACCDPPLDRVYIHRAPSTREYDRIPHTYLEAVSDLVALMPQMDFGPKTLVILEDQGKLAGKAEYAALDELLRVYASHHGLTVLMACQNAFDVPPALRRKFDVYHIFTRNCDVDLIVRHLQLKKAQKALLSAIVASKADGAHDYVTIDMLSDQPFGVNGKKCV